MNEMKVKVAHDVHGYANELYVLKKERTELIKELFLDGECIFGNSDIRKLDDLIQQAKIDLEVAFEKAKEVFKGFES